MISAEHELVSALVRDVRAGRRDAFRLLVERFEPRLLGLVISMIKDAGAAEEIVQDAFVRAYIHLDRYDERRELFPWLATIAVRLAQNRLQRRTRRRGTLCAAATHWSGGDVPTAAGDATAVATADPMAEAISEESRHNLWHSVAKLPQGERTAVHLCYAQGMRISEIAQVLRVTEGTVKAWLFRARKKLRGQLMKGDML
jgi:RNA polymerase sigma-70 factor (ECF subfamily)